ncbi:MAG: adenylyl-sulfate kinase, partial [Ilumatobacteraceae bacterium]
ARLMADAGIVVLVSFISPFRAEREMARERAAEIDFVEVHVDVPLDVAESRDPKGLYAKARRGELANFTGIDSPYEPPESPELRIDGATTSVADAALAVHGELVRRGIVRG